MNVVQVLQTLKEPVLFKEATKEQIRATQMVLKAIGIYKGEVDGIVGKKSLEALAEFKQKEYLGMPEYLGETTATALIEAYAPRKAPVEAPPSALSPTPQAHVIDVGTVRVSDPIYPGSHFTWGEATKGLTRRPESQLIVQNIIKAAKVMDEVRAFFGGRPITVNSWYRPPAVNKAVGGATNSRHLYGDAVDFTVQGISPFEVNRRLDSWYGARGGLASASGFTHIDCRGTRARWRYN